MEGHARLIDLKGHRRRTAGHQKILVARGSAVDTMSLPSGAIATAASLKFPRPRGIPMIVRHSNRPKSTCAIAIQKPANRNHTRLPMAEATPAVGFLATVLPNGHST